MTTMTKRQIKPSERTFAAARKLAREAVKRDHWFSPYPEEDIRDTDTLACHGGTNPVSSCPSSGLLCLAVLGADFVLLGHTHVQGMRAFGRITVS